MEWLPEMPWNECPRSRGITAHLSWNAQKPSAAIGVTSTVQPYSRCDIHSRDQAGIGRWQFWLRAVTGGDGGGRLCAGRNEHKRWDQNSKRLDDHQDFLHGSVLLLTEAADVTENAGASFLSARLRKGALAVAPGRDQ